MSAALRCGYTIYGCDVSATAYGLYESGFAQTYRVRQEDYERSVTEACLRAGATWLIPGGEQPLKLLRAGLGQAGSGGDPGHSANDPSIIEVFTDKKSTFERLAELGIPTPRTIALDRVTALEDVGLPCIVKPGNAGSGPNSGSVLCCHRR